MRSTITLVLLVASGSAFAQQGGRSELLESLTAAGTEAAVAVSRSLEALEPAVRDMLAPVIAGWIRDTRDEAAARGIREIPPGIRDEFAGFVPAVVLDTVRWRIDDTIVSVQQGLFATGYTPAVTVDDVILFADAEAAANPALWAHELYHVIQYRNWTVDGFAERYLEDYSALEHEANEFAWQWFKATNRSPMVAN